jgi:hypothetical protein
MKKRKLLWLAILLPFIIKCKTDVAPSKQSSEPVQKETIVEVPQRFAVPTAFTPQQQHFFIDPSRDTVLSIGDKGTQLHIPQNAFVNELGELLHEKVNLTFQEYKNSAEMAFSKIPMTYKKGSEEFCFNSSGMFSIKGDCLGQEAFIAENKSLEIDYFLPLHNENIDFYRLENDSSNWELIAEIEELKKEEPIAPLVNEEAIIPEAIAFERDVLILDEMLLERNLAEAEKSTDYIYDASGMFLNQRPDKDVAHLCDSLGDLIANDIIAGRPVIYGLLDCRLMNFLIKDKKVDLMPYVAILPISDVENERIALINNNLRIARNNRLLGGQQRMLLVDNGDRVNATLLAGRGDKGHTYPPIIKGLNIESFGVYNCDQIYRLPNPVNLLATYVDEKGNAINDADVLSMIDLNYNGAFSFDPKSFMCSTKGDNVLALFTSKGELYLLEKGAFDKMNITSSGSYTFVMKNKTETIKNTADLAAYLDI